MPKTPSHQSRLFTALVSGLIFGTGLILSGMANPAKVLAFLDLAGLWNPSLILVMLGAISIGLIAFHFAKKRSQSLLGESIDLPEQQNIDNRLIAGSLLFGVGWGMAGICPGPALVLLGLGNFKGIIFLLAMFAGMFIFEVIENRTKQL